jgi:signal transduction histidine kinase
MGAPVSSRRIFALEVGVETAWRSGTRHARSIREQERRPAVRHKILIAEDDAAQQRLVAHALRGLECEIVYADTGDAALEIIRTQGIALAILDWKMPGCTGPEICQEVRRWERPIHCIVLTANDSKADLHTALEAGASDFLAKPFHPIELRARVQVGLRLLDFQARMAQTQKMESLGVLAAGVAHEINTPIQFVGDNIKFIKESFAELSLVIRQYGDLVSRAAQVEELRADAAKALAAAESAEIDYLIEEIPQALEQSGEGVDRVASIVRAMKSFAHPGAEGAGLSDLNEAIQSTVTVSRNEWKHLADLRLELDPDLPLVECVLPDINQVVLNLIVNAAHAIEASQREQPGTIVVRSTREGDLALISVEDTGIGIPEEIRGRIFDRFFTTKGVGKGTGQGLALAYDIVVRHHGGTIHVASTPGVGTTFHVRLPLRYVRRDVPEDAGQAE